MKSNNLRKGTYEFLDFPMEKWAEESGEGNGKEEVGGRDWGEGRQREGAQFGVHIPGRVMHAYLEDCVYKMGLRGSLRLRTRALRAEEVALEEKGGRKGWIVRVVDVEHGEDEGREGTSDSSANPKQYEIRCDKLIIASDLCSTPRPMQIKGQETFNKPIVNFSELGRKARALLDDDNVKHVTVLGGSKAACDCVYMFASQGKKVSWIIRRTGHGPCWMSPPYAYVGPVKCWLEMLVTSRWMTWLSPCVWGDSHGFGWIRKALHNTRV
jgi:cation diffusion facilitator CzcD-associated flavoprotein CzcO